MSKFIVASSAAKMPNKCWGRYRRVAVLEVEEGVEIGAVLETDGVGGEGFGEKRLRETFRVCDANHPMRGRCIRRQRHRYRRAKSDAFNVVALQFQCPAERLS
jgi:hypothetical protein